MAKEIEGTLKDSLNADIITCQPRIFSPGGSVFEFPHTNILFDLIRLSQNRREPIPDLARNFCNLSGIN